MLIAFLSFSANAETEIIQNTAKQKAQKAIESCWEISEKDRAGSTASVREGTLNSALCMEEHIVELSKKYFFPHSPHLVLEVKEDLEKTRAGYGRLYWNLYNSLDHCFEGSLGLGCGTLYHTFHNAEYAKLLEGVIFDFYAQIENYELKSKN
jgi:hypothetical protein